MRLVCVSDLAARGAKPTALFGAGPKRTLSLVIARDRIALRRFGEVEYYYIVAAITVPGAKKFANGIGSQPYYGACRADARARRRS